MKKQVPIGVLVAVVVVALALVGFLFMRATAGSSGVWTNEQQELADAIEKVGGDTSKLDPETRKRLDEELAKHPMSSGRGGSSGPGPGSGTPGGPAASGTTGGSPIPQDYPTGR